MNARIIAYNLFSVFLCPVMLPWQPTGTNYREEGPHLGFYIYIYIYIHINTPQTGDPLFHMQTSWRKLILTVSASRMRKWKSPKRFKHLVSIWLLLALSSTNTHAPDSKTVVIQFWQKKPVFAIFAVLGNHYP